MNFCKLQSNTHVPLNIDRLWQWAAQRQDADRKISGEVLFEDAVVGGKPTLIFAVGIAGSGKSTISRMQGIEVKSTDAARLNKLRKDLGRNPSRQEKMERLARYFSCVSSNS